VIRNEVEGATVEVYNIAGDLREAQTRKTVLQKGGLARCGMDGGRIALRSILSTFARIKGEENTPNGKKPTGRPQTPKGIRRVSSSSSLKQKHVTTASHSRPKRDGPLMIPSVDVTVTPFLSVDADLPNVYAVRVCLVDYVVKDRSGGMNNVKGKRKANDGTRLDVFLPTFQLPVGRLVVNVESDRGMRKRILSLYSITNGTFKVYKLRLCGLISRINNHRLMVHGYYIIP
jgi:hypothetical protein